MISGYRGDTVYKIPDYSGDVMYKISEYNDDAVYINSDYSDDIVDKILEYSDVVETSLDCLIRISSHVLFQVLVLFCFFQRAI